MPYKINLLKTKVSRFIILACKYNIIIIEIVQFCFILCINVVAL